MNMLILAEMELKREGKDPTNNKLLVDRMIKIRKWFDKHGKHADAIMQGEQIYKYGNQIKTYALKG